LAILQEALSICLDWRNFQGPVTISWWVGRLEPGAYSKFLEAFWEPRGLIEVLLWPPFGVGWLLFFLRGY